MDADRPALTRAGCSARAGEFGRNRRPQRSATEVAAETQLGCGNVGVRINFFLCGLTLVLTGALRQAALGPE